MVSIIVPAHNEEEAIGATLTALVGSHDVADLEIVVVCNGCTDATATIARSFGPAVTVIETATAGKVHALDIGDQAARRFPRLYVDGDVVVQPSTVARLVEALDEPGVLAVAPAVEIDDSHSSLAVRAYLSVWKRLPQVHDSLAGRGVYALAEEGRRRFGRFPDVVNDDGYVNALFSNGTRRTVQSVCSKVMAPRNLDELTHRRVRVMLGNRELRQLGLDPRAEHRTRTELTRIARREPALIGAVGIYVAVTFAVRVRAAARTRRGDARGWSTAGTGAGVAR